MKFILPVLPYNYNDLEPYFDTETMKIHHTKHHQTYVNNTNCALENISELVNLEINDLLKTIKNLSEDKKTILRNNAGGHANHSLFWKGLKQGTILHGALNIAIQRNFGSITRFKEKFEKVAMTVFGSGWIWLIKQEEKLIIASTVNQDNPLMGKEISGISGYPIFCLDVWEHAYYLKYQNRRLDYIKSFWNVLNWNEANARFSNI